jgi:hypothetical protein
MKYRALRNITAGELIAANTEDLTAEQFGGQDATDRLERLGAIEKMSGKKKADAPETEEAQAEPKTPIKTGGPVAAKEK